MSLFSKKLILVLLLKFFGVTTVAWGAERWSPSITYGEIVSKAQAGSPYFQGLLGIYLRSGEAGSKVDVKLAKQWSESAHRKGHPFGSYNLANLAMMDGDRGRPECIKMRLFCCKGRHHKVTRWPCTVWERSIFR